MVSLLPPRLQLQAYAHPRAPVPSPRPLPVMSFAPTRCHNYSFTLEKYMLLQEQHDELSSHLRQICARQQPAASSISTRSSSTSSTPLRRRTAARLDTIVDEQTLCAISADEKRLFDVNESIKRALTELLNCDAVRCDKSMRMWAQARLMETEKELRSGRRRRSTPCIVG